jgi:hypothetical protein
MTVGICIAIALATLGLHAVFGVIFVRIQRRYATDIEKINNDHVRAVDEIYREHEETLRQIDREHEENIARIDGLASPTPSGESKTN